MQQLVDELRQVLPLKKTTARGDIVIVAAENPQILTYAYVREIERDTSRRDEWWHLHLTILAIPLQQMTWTLRTAQMTGQEIFTMGGEKRFVQAVDCRVSADTPHTTGPADRKGPVSALKRVK
jgi:hypothetical protein